MAFTYIWTRVYNDNEWDRITTTTPNASTQNWDIVFAIVRNNSFAVTTPWSWWTLLWIGNDTIELRYKIENSAWTSYWWIWWWIDSCSVRYYTYRWDFNTSDPIDIVSNTIYTTSNTTIRAASINVTNTNSPLIFFWNVYSVLSVTHTKPSVPTTNWVEDDDAGSTTSDMWTEVCSMIWTWSWATWDIDATMSSTQTIKHWFAVALNPPSLANTTNFFQLF